MPDYIARLARVQQQMRAQGVDLLFLTRSANLSYVTGVQREQPNFGNTMYPGEWLTGAWIPRDGAPILTVPQMIADFHVLDAGSMEVRVLGPADSGLPRHSSRLGPSQPSFSLGNALVECNRGKRFAAVARISPRYLPSSQ